LKKWRVGWGRTHLKLWGEKKIGVRGKTDTEWLKGLPPGDKGSFGVRGGVKEGNGSQPETRVVGWGGHACYERWEKGMYRGKGSSGKSGQHRRGVKQ